MTSCRLVHTQLHAFADGEMAPQMAREINLHAAGCDPCAARIDAAEKLALQLHEAGLRARLPPPSLLERIMTSLPEGAPSVRHRFKLGGLSGLLALLAACGLHGLARVPADTGAGSLGPGWSALTPLLPEALDHLGSPLVGFNWHPVLPSLSPSLGLTGPHLLPVVLFCALGLSGGMVAALLIAVLRSATPPGRAA